MHSEYGSLKEGLEDFRRMMETNKGNKTSNLSAQEFENLCMTYEEKETDKYWSIAMKSYGKNGEWRGSQYKLATFPPSLCLDDFLVHYTMELHERWFLKRPHAERNYIYVYRSYHRKMKLVLFYECSE